MIDTATKMRRPKGDATSRCALGRLCRRAPRPSLTLMVQLNEEAFQHAMQLIRDGRLVLDSRDDWSASRPSARAEYALLEEQGFGEYGKWYLGVDPEQDEDMKTRYKFPIGDFAKVHRGGVLTAEARAGQFKYPDIQRAAAQLHGMLDALEQGDQPSPA
jgi:hypothetical protein